MKDLLVKQGLNEEQVTNILNAMSEAKIYTTSLENVDVRYNKLQEQKKQLEEASKGYEKQLKDLSKNNADIEALNKMVEQLQLSNKELEAKHKLEMEKLQFDFALDKGLTDAKCKDNKVVKALLDMNSIKCQEGKLTGLQEQIEALQKDASYLFDIETTPGGSGFNPAGTNSGEARITKEKFKTMNMVQRIKLKNDDPQLYEELSQ